MSKSRVLSATESLYSGPSPSTGWHYLFTGIGGTGGGAGLANSGVSQIHQLYRVQSCDWDFNIPRQNVSQFGEFAPIDQIILQSPTVSLGFTYLLANFYNEASGLGLTVCPSGAGGGATAPVSALSGFLTKVNDERNYWLKISREGIDSVGDTESNTNVNNIGIGNGFVSSYSANFAVGQLPTVDVKVDALNIVVGTGLYGTVPAIIPSAGTRATTLFTLPTATEDPGAGINDFNISALRPGDITLSINKRAANESYAQGVYDIFGADLTTGSDTVMNARIQSANISFSLNRQAIEKLGSKFAVSREVQFPVEVTTTIDAIQTDLLTGDLSALINCDSQYDLGIAIKRPATCGSSSQPIVANYIIKGAKLQSQNSRINVDSNGTVSLNFTSQIGGPNQVSQGLFLSGSCIELF